jgi:hypothetical protein
MNEDYLWDRSGEADEEIEELEELLGTLKYQPRPLDIPASVTVGRKSFALRAFAIAATIALLLFGAGLWRSRQGSPVTQGVNTANVPAPDKSNEVTASNPERPTKDLAPALISHTTFKRGNGSRHSSLAARETRIRVAAQTAAQLPKSEVAEAQAAKQQLLLALRVASAKLTVAQKRMQGANPANQIQNQHKIG